MLAYLNERDAVVKQLGERFKSQPAEIVERVVSLQSELKASQKALAAAATAGSICAAGAGVGAGAGAGCVSIATGAAVAVMNPGRSTHRVSAKIGIFDP